MVHKSVAVSPPLWSRLTDWQTSTAMIFYTNILCLWLFNNDSYHAAISILAEQEVNPAFSEISCKMVFSFLSKVKVQSYGYGSTWLTRWNLIWRLWSRCPNHSHHMINPWHTWVGDQEWLAVFVRLISQHRKNNCSNIFVLVPLALIWFGCPAFDS